MLGPVDKLQVFGLGRVDKREGLGLGPVDKGEALGPRSGPSNRSVVDLVLGTDS